MKKSRRSIKGHILFILLILTTIGGYAQSGVSLQNIETINVDAISDAELSSFWQQAQGQGYNLDQVKQIAVQRRMNPAEADKLISRLARLQKVPSGVNEAIPNLVDVPRVQRYTEKVATDSLAARPTRFNSGPPIFGEELFSSKNLTFEPNLKIPTPVNYQLGPDDELIIEVYGFSEATYRTTVTPEGYIRIPTVGIVEVAGLTIEQARKKIVAQLKTIYGGMSSGQTSVSITLGRIKSIRVILLGEVNLPGTYTMSSLSTVMNALYASGGPNMNGSFRNIRLIRGGKVVSVIDIYDILMNGESAGNLTLQDQDIIKVAPYETRVELKGEVKRPGLYEAKQGEAFSDLLRYGGGFTDKAYKDRVNVVRNTSTQKSVADINAAAYGMFLPVSGDVYTVGAILDRFENRVRLTGAVFRPGDYAVEEGMTLKKLIEKADGLKGDAFLTRGVIRRLKEDNSLEVISFDLNDVMSGKQEIIIQREDQVIINSKFDLREAYVVTIYGEVRKPGVFAFAEHMKVEDLIISAGGLKEGASVKRIEIARRMDSADRMAPTSAFATILDIEISKDLKENPELATFVLEPFDIVTVFPDPGFVVQKTIRIEGNVLYPGEYVLSKNNARVSDVLKRAGGITADGFAEGAVMIRTRSKDINQRLIDDNKRRALFQMVEDTLMPDEKAMELRRMTSTEVVSLNMERILRSPGGKEDVILLENDVINIPKQQQTVTVSGEVFFPVKTVFIKGTSYNSYVKLAGGYTKRALKNKAYVVYANGSAKASSSFLFIKFRPKVKPGSEIVVPIREEKRKMTTTETLSILTSTVTLMAVIATLLR